MKHWHISKIQCFVTSTKTVIFLSVIGGLQVYFNIYKFTYEKQRHWYQSGNIQVMIVTSLLAASYYSLTHISFTLICEGCHVSGMWPYVDKGEFHPISGHDGPERELRYSSTLSLTSALDGGGWSTSRHGRFTPGKDPVPIVYRRLGGSQGRSEQVRKISPPPTGIRSPDRPARSESLYRLCQRFSNFFQVGTTFISQNVLRTTLLLGLSNSLGLP